MSQRVEAGKSKAGGTFKWTCWMNRYLREVEFLRRWADVLQYKVANTLSISSSRVPTVILKISLPKGPGWKSISNHCITNTPTHGSMALPTVFFVVFIEMEFDSSSSVVCYNPEQLPPENSSFLERSFVCRFRCLLDNSSGFLVRDIFCFYQS